MKLQQDQLDQLSDWLNQMDARIKNYAMIGGNEDEVRKQIEDIKVTSSHKRLALDMNCQLRFITVQVVAYIG